MPELRQAVARHSQQFAGLEVDWQTETLVTCGATEALAAAFMGLLNPGDEVGHRLVLCLATVAWVPEIELQTSRPVRALQLIALPLSVTTAQPPLRSCADESTPLLQDSAPWLQSSGLAGVTLCYACISESGFGDLGQGDSLATWVIRAVDPCQLTTCPSAFAKPHCPLRRSADGLPPLVCC